LVDILPFGSESVDPQIFADPGSQNLADPTDPDPKHWFRVTLSVLIIIVYMIFIHHLPTIRNFFRCQMINFSFQRYLLDFSAHLPLTLIVEHCIPIQYQGCTFLIKRFTNY